MALLPPPTCKAATAGAQPAPVASRPAPAVRPGPPNSDDLLRRIRAVARQDTLLDQSLLARALDVRFLRSGSASAEAAWLSAWDAALAWIVVPGPTPEAGASAQLRLRLGARAPCIGPEDIERTLGRDWRPLYTPETRPSLPRMRYLLRARPGFTASRRRRETTLEIGFRTGLCADDFLFLENPPADR